MLIPYPYGLVFSASAGTLRLSFFGGFLDQLVDRGNDGVVFDRLTKVCALVIWLITMTSVLEKVSILLSNFFGPFAYFTFSGFVSYDVKPLKTKIKKSGVI